MILSETAANLSCRVLRTVPELQEIASEWRDLFHRSRATAFQSPDWVLPWIQVFKPEKMVAIAVRSGSRLVGLAPLLIHRREQQRVLAFVGGGVSDYLDFLIDPQFETEVTTEMFSAILQLGEPWTVLDLTDLPSGSLLLAIPWLKREARKHDSCSVLRLPANQDDLLHLFSKRQRANLRNARSRLQRAGGGQIELASAENVLEFLDDLFTLHSSRWSERGEPGVLSDLQLRTFHKSSTPHLLASGMLHLSRLRSQNKTLAVIYSLFAHETAFCYLQGFDPEFAALSPGTQLMFHVMCEGVQHGIRQFDFLRGREVYKQHWRPSTQPTYRIQLTREALAAGVQNFRDLRVLNAA
jgi:CelD/BcsL family acetyltransferase involved in cellulose biosynthesis